VVSICVLLNRLLLSLVARDQGMYPPQQLAFPTLIAFNIRIFVLNVAGLFRHYKPIQPVDLYSSRLYNTTVTLQMDYC